MDEKAMNTPRKPLSFTITDAKLQLEAHEEKIQAQAHTIMELEAYRDNAKEQLEQQDKDISLILKQLRFYDALFLTDSPPAFAYLVEGVAAMMARFVKETK